MITIKTSEKGMWKEREVGRKRKGWKINMTQLVYIMTSPSTLSWVNVIDHKENKGIKILKQYKVVTQIYYFKNDFLNTAAQI